MAQQREAKSMAVALLLSDAQLTLTGTVDRTIKRRVANIGLESCADPSGADRRANSAGCFTQTTTAGLAAKYDINLQWFANCQLTYNRTEFIGSTRLDNSWLLDAYPQIRYLAEHVAELGISLHNYHVQYAFVSATSSYGMMGATYKF